MYEYHSSNCALNRRKDTRVKAGKPVRRLLQSSRHQMTMVAWLSVGTIEVMRKVRFWIY